MLATGTITYILYSSDPLNDHENHKATETAYYYNYSYTIRLVIFVGLIFMVWGAQMILWVYIFVAHLL